MSSKKLDPVYLNARRETIFVIVTWCVFCLWVVGYSVNNGYDLDPTQLKTVMGMPAWIFWGVALPWLMANVVAIYFGLKFMADDPLEDPPAEQPAETKATGEEPKNG
ncbi:MAG: DUF997 family protein [Limisphaerales bacterium]